MTDIRELKSMNEIDKRKIILFGCGEVGYRLLSYFGAESVFAFCDNSCKERGVKYGVTLIPYAELKSVVEECILILSVNPQNAGDIINQLIGDEIRDFIVYDSIFSSEMKRSTASELLSILNDDSDRLARERDYFLRRLNAKDEQLEFLERISDIHKLNPAKGYVSAVKRELKAYVKDIFDFLSDLKIKPFTAAGTAIGLSRHNDFIQCDDDVDFGLFRQDYMKLIEFGRNNLPFIEVSLGKEGDRLQADYFRKYPNEYFMLVSPNCLQIKKGTSWIDANTIDFFPYDFYEDDYPYEKHLKNIRECASWRRLETGTKRILDLIENQGHTCIDSNKISFGLDGMDSYVCPEKGWMKREVMLPLRETDFEGIPCYAPNNLREYLSYCYKEFEGYPSDIGALHDADRREILKTFYISMMIVVEDEEFIRFKEMYHRLRNNGVNCLFFLNRKYLIDKSQYDIIKGKLIDAEVQYTSELDLDFDCFIAGERAKKELEMSGERKIVYDASEEPEIIFKYFVEDILCEKFESEKTRLCLLNG